MNLVQFYRMILYLAQSFVSKVRVIHEFGAISQKDTISYAVFRFSSPVLFMNLVQFYRKILYLTRSFVSKVLCYS